jgi:hypothetical protein
VLLWQVPGSVPGFSDFPQVDLYPPMPAAPSTEGRERWLNDFDG